MRVPKPGGDGRFPRFRSLVLLAGTVRPTPLLQGIRRSLVDLPLGPGTTVLADWLDRVSDLAGAMGVDEVDVRVLLDDTAPEPAPRDAPERVGLIYERDAKKYRGPGGVLKDILRDYDDDDLFLVGTASQIPGTSLTDALSGVDADGADVTILADRDGTPSGLLLIRRECVHVLPEEGFVDLKEQGLPRIAERHSIQVVRRPGVSGMPLRRLPEYIRFLRARYRGDSEDRLQGSPFAEEWKPRFSIVEDGAEVGADARIHDSVVLAGGRVEPGARVVRSLVCPGGVVKSGSPAVDELVGGRR